MDFRIENYPIIFDEVEYLHPQSAWLMHAPLAFLLVEVLKPKIIVELGTHVGYSYNALCQAVKKLKLNTKCYAVDTWVGDKHSSFYDESVYIKLKKYQDENYKDFSTLLKMTFDEAVNKFDNGSIDLLHIDGLHTYEAVKHDFETWLSKMSNRGVVLFHDTEVREADFGVYRFFDDITSNYKKYFNFKHGHGLGVVLVGSEYSSELINLVEKFKNEVFYEKLFYSLGSVISLKVENLELNLKVENLELKKENSHFFIRVLRKILKILKIIK